jgi:ubiquinone biosynthesis protein UbiJ
LIAAGLVERSLNHLLQQTPGAADALVRHAGAGVRFDLSLAQLDFRIADDGYFSETAIDTPDAVIRPTPALVARLPFFGREALRLADYQGDPALLATLDRVFRQLDWDVEADLAPLVGDIAAHRLHTFGRDALAGLRQAASALGVNASEYVVEEAELMARRVDVDRFNRDVDTLADAVARLEARLRVLDADSRLPNSAVIASEAKQSRAAIATTDSGSPRLFKPRDDGMSEDATQA